MPLHTTTPVAPNIDAKSVPVVGYNILGLETHTSLSASYAVTALDDEKQFTCTTDLPILVGPGLVPAPSFMAIPPSGGTLTLTPTGGATINGSASSATRTFANNRNGVVVTPNPYVVDDYSLSGS